MNPTNLVELSIIAFCISAIWYLYFWLYKECTVDCFRQDVFELRDKLFDEAQKGLIKFDHPAYCLLRRTMNGTIRYSHKVSILHMIFIAFLFKKREVEKQNFSFDKKFEVAISSENEKTRKKLLEYRKELQKITLLHLIRESPFTFFLIISLVFILSIPAFLIMLFGGKILFLIKSILSTEIDSLESTALAAGKL